MKKVLEKNNAGSEQNTDSVLTNEAHQGTDKALNARRAPNKGSDNRNNKRGQGGSQSSDSGQIKPEFEERVVAVARVAKVVKGGRRFSFSALIVVGDKSGRVGFGLGKAREVPEAIRKAGQNALKKIVKVPLDKGTIPHEVLGLFGAGKIIFKPAGEGTGIKAAGACRTILELAGVKNVLTKSLRGSNPHNVVRATFEALSMLRSAKDIAVSRSLDIKSVRLK